jgi:hypothetical protein
MMREIPSSLPIRTRVALELGSLGPPTFLGHVVDPACVPEQHRQAYGRAWVVWCNHHEPKFWPMPIRIYLERTRAQRAAQNITLESER